jgi:RNA polymerase sigma-70 factor (ECF subfamily)
MDMDLAARAALEQRIRDAHQAKEMNAAITEALTGYGSDLLRYLMAVLHDDTEASEVYADLCETLWCSLPNFRWECSFRTWAYLLARHTLSGRNRDPQHKLGQPMTLSRSPEVWDLAERVRTSTLTYLKTETKDRFAELRAELTEEQRSLLVLRVNREMGWDEIACIMLGDPQPEPTEVQRKAAALRKQYQRIKNRLRKLASERGLLHHNDSADL